MDQILMVQDETTSPGYCLLQKVIRDVPMPEQGVHLYCFTDDSGRVLVRHSLCLPLADDGFVRHGPALSINLGDSVDSDYVDALRCLSRPKEAYPWLEQQNVGGWPTADLKRYSVDHGCFVVPVGSKNGVYEDLEWRISTSFAERCLMFSLNLTQMMCYILMKMIVKDCIKPRCNEAISSFMCKNVLFHCISDSRPGEWRDFNLMTCFTRCLQVLLNCVLTENCPHFMIPRNNLLSGKLSVALKHQLVEIMCTLTGNIEQVLLGISIDNLGSRIMVKSSHIINGVYLRTAADIAAEVSKCNISGLVACLQVSIYDNLKNISDNNASVSQTLVQNVSKLCQLYLAGNRIQQAACKLLIPFFCSFVSSVTASVDIQHSHALSLGALWWFSSGLNSDFSSNRLKLASALFCAGDLERCEVLLADLERKFRSEIVANVCFCCRLASFSNEFGRLCVESNENVIKHNIAFSVRYLSCEVNCIPAELKYELFRSTADDLPYRSAFDDRMNCTVVDSLPYLYFLQYKVYSQLRRPADQYRALDNLARMIGTEPKLGHRETAQNLLGQCMEQENRQQDALRYFILSLNVKERNKAAKWHLCRMLAAMFR